LACERYQPLSFRVNGHLTPRTQIALEQRSLAERSFAVV
jgi:hypothetical protein